MGEKNPDTRFLYAARGAVGRLCASFAQIAEARIFIEEATPLTKIREIHYKGGGAIALPLPGRAYSMRAYGKGRITVKDGADVKSFDFDTRGKRLAGFMKVGGELILEGDSPFTLTDVTSFSEAPWSSLEDIPSGAETKTVNAERLIPDFEALVALPKDSKGRCVSCEVCDGRITLPSDFHGELVLHYKRRPTEPSLDDLNSSLDLPRGIEFALPYLVAYYLLLDDDPEKAEKYKEIYDKAIKETKREALSRSYPEIITNGWA